MLHDMGENKAKQMRCYNNVKPTLLVVAPSEYYINTVANVAMINGLVGNIVTTKTTNIDEFTAAIAPLNRNNLIIAKGMPETAEFLRTVLRYNNRELIRGGKGGFYSSTGVFIKKDPTGHYTRPIMLSDGAINIAPTIEQKIKIVRAAVDMYARLFPFADEVEKTPVISMITPAGRYASAIQSSIDAAAVISALPGLNMRFDQLDTALSKNIRRIKNMDGGAADIIISNGLDDGNAIWKSLTVLAGYSVAGFVTGTTLPMILNSRGDTPESKLLSIELATKLI